MDSQAEEILKKEAERIKTEWGIWHGSLGNEKWAIPKCVARTDKVNRKGSSIKASEYIDYDDVLDEKMKIVADIIRKAKFCVVYTGAGISRASGIPDYGTQAENSVMNAVEKVSNPYYALPTYSHYALTRLEKEGYIKCYIQQNHDGLPQKAGFPQEKMNEIHGAWYDPSNPVVRMSGNLRSDLFKQLKEIEEKIDLCLCMGTSLSGMNADRVVSTPCEKFWGGEVGKDGGYGSVIINLQFTPMDKLGYCPIRVWSKIDDAMRLLMKHLKLEMDEKKNVYDEPWINLIGEDRIVCPYDEKGKLDHSKKMVLDLSIGQNVIIVHPGATNEGKIGRVARKDQHGHYLISFGDRTRRMGTWWMKCLKEGRIERMPLMNYSGKELDDEEMEKEYRTMRGVPGCNYCERIGQLKFCRGCHSVYYCNQNCQNLDWKKHKVDCKKMKKKN